MPSSSASHNTSLWFSPVFSKTLVCPFYHLTLYRRARPPGDNAVYSIRRPAFLYATQERGVLSCFSSDMSRKANGKREPYHGNQSIQIPCSCIRGFICILVTAATLSYNTMPKNIFLNCRSSISLLTSTQKSLGNFLY